MIVTCWNMQGAQASTTTSSGKRKALEGLNISDALSLLSHGVDVLALQEVGGAPDWGLAARVVGGVNLDVGVVELGSRRRRVQAKVVWYDSLKTNAKHDRCSMAVIATNYSNNATTVRAVAHHNANLRPLVGIRTALNIWVYSIHAPSGNHNAASGVAYSMLGQIPNSHWICAGDYNCSPADMRNRGLPANRVIATTNATHQNGNTLDFAVRSPLAIVSLHTGVGTLTSDHYSQSFRVS